MQEPGKWGYIDKAGEFIIPPQLRTPFLSRMGGPGRYPAGSDGYIDTTGRIVWSSHDQVSGEGCLSHPVSARWGQ